MQKRKSMSKKEWQKLAERFYNGQNGICPLCDGEIIDWKDPQLHQIDEIIEIASGGKQEPSNQFLVHKRCNQKKRDLGFERARAILRLDRINAKKAGKVNLDDILDVLLDARKEVSIKTHSIGDSKQADIFFGEKEITCPIFHDARIPDLEYIMFSCPIEYISLDKELQPRFLQPHINDFLQGTWHQPFLDIGHARISIEEGTKGKILLFNGQHRAALCILSNRKKLDLKLFLNPTSDQLKLLNETNVEAHEKFKQRPAAAPDAARRLASIYKNEWDAFVSNPKFLIKSEMNFLRSITDSSKRSRLKKWLTQYVLDSVMKSEDNRFSGYVEQGSSKTTSKALTYDSIKKSFIKYFSNPEPYNVGLANIDLDADPRQIEVDNIVGLMNIFAEKVLLGKWDSDIGPSFRTSVSSGNSEHYKALRLTRPSVLQVICELLQRAIYNDIQAGYIPYSPDSEIKKALANATQQTMFSVRLPSQVWEQIERIVTQLVDHKLWNEPSSEIDNIIQAVSPGKARLLILEGRTSENGTPKFEPITLDYLRSVH